MSAGAVRIDRAVRPSVAAFLEDPAARTATIFAAEAGGDAALWHFAEARYRAVAAALERALGDPAFELARTREIDPALAAMAPPWSRTTLWALPAERPGEGMAIAAALLGLPGEALEVGLCRGPWP